jgi:subfamily B ATP-binding cassette protein MsbA
LTVFTLLVAPLVVAAVYFFSRRLRRISVDVQDRLADVSTVLEETLSGVRIVKSFSRESHEVERFTRRVERNFRSAMRRAQARALFLPLITFLAFLALAVVLWYGGREVIAGRITPGDLVAFLFYAVMVATPISAFTGLYAQFQEALGATERVFQLLDERPELIEIRGARPMPPIRGRVQFQGVSFDYDPRDEVLRDIELTVAPGEIIALVGPSGAGKSTLVNLIPRFYDPDNGRILIDGLDIRTVQMKSLREQIGIVPQETILFGGSIRENISYGKLDASDHEVVAAARAANAHDFIVSLPDGYHTIVGERGTKLSGGERQRISIARAILKDPRVLILDEATSSLDTESERLVQEALDRLMHGRTTFVIAHRLSTVNNADVIIYLAEGRIMERGTHRELMARQGLYHRLYSMQFASPPAGGGAEAEIPAAADEEGLGAEEERSPFTLLSEWSRGKSRR